MTHARSSTVIGWTSMLVEHRVASAGRVVVEPPPSPDYQIVLRLSGGTRTETFRRGHWRGEVYDAGSLALLGGGESCRARYTTNRPDHVGVLVVPHHVVTQSAEFLRRPGRVAPRPPRCVVGCSHPGVAGTARALLNGVARGFPDLYAEQAARWLALQLLTLDRGWSTTVEPPSPASLTDARLERVIDLVRATPSEPLTLDRLAAEAGISKFHFTRVFRAATGMTPAAYVEHTRLTAAARRLVTTADPIEAIARASGYAGADQFRVAFRRKHGMSPSAYRRG